MMSQTTNNRKKAPFGSWSSKITPDLFAKCNCKSICELQVFRDAVYWVEQNAVTGKRELYSQKKNGEKTRWADGHSVQTAVHEYGGGALYVHNDGSVFFATIEGLFYQKSHDTGIEQLAEASNRTFRFSDCSASDTHVFCVNETHQIKGQDPENRLISIDRKTKDQVVVASGADFYAYPRVSPDGKKLVWMQWSHINMPWDETSIRMAKIEEDGTTTGENIIRDGTGKQINYTEPLWASDKKLMLAHDATNWWNVYELEVETLTEKNVNPVQQEIGYPLWQLGFKNYSVNDRCIVMNVGGRLQVRRGDVVKHVPTPEYTVFGYISLSQTSDDLYLIASGPKKASSVLRIDMADESFPITVVREARNSADIDALDISLPEEVTFKSDGVDVSGYFYPPKNSEYVAPAGSSPPVLLMGHGGPTAPAFNDLDLKKQFFTSRGVAVFDINYRGSTGFGTEFRNKLKKQLGIIDRNDMLNGARALIEQNLVDPDRVLISGSSAGGFLLLTCLIHPENIIKAAVSLYGVADLVALEQDTHKFERCYNQVLIGKYPEEAHLYEERSPINHIDKISTPIAFIHGKDDPVVPVSQSEMMFTRLRDRGVMTSLLTFDGEGHGFRGEIAVRESTEAAYYFLMSAVGIEPSVESKIEIVNPRIPSN